jgi:DNA-binding phage protein
MPERRTNDILIINSLAELKQELKDHREEMQHAIHGNGNPGLKTKVEVLATRVMVLWGAMVAAIGFIFNDYINRG